MRSPRTVRVALATVSSGPGWRESALVGALAFAVFRVLTELIGLIAAYRGGVGRRLAADPGVLAGIWKQWDVSWFVNISERGYRSLSHVVEVDGTYHDGTAFPPAVPLLMHAGRVLGIPSDVTGLLASSVFLVVGLALLYWLTTIDFGEVVARWSVVFLLAYPFALFLGTAYAESLVLMCVAGGFLAARRRYWLLAGVAVGIALLAKIVFILLLVPLTLEWLAAGSTSASALNRRRRSASLAALWLPALVALGGWMLYLQLQFHEPLRFVSAQRLWGRAIGLPLAQAGYVFNSHGNAGLRFINAIDLLAVAFLGVMAVYAYRRLRRPYGVLLGMFFLLFVFNTSLESNGRHLSVLFPIFVGLAVWSEGRSWVRPLLVVAQLPLAVLLVARFASGHWAG